MRSFASIVALTTLALAGCRDTAPAPSRPRTPSAPPIVRHVPVEPTAAVIQIAAGRDSACALFRDGHVACWGDNAFTSQSLMIHGIPPARRITPARVANVDHAVEITMGSTHGCARFGDGSVKCWRDRTTEPNSDPALSAEPAPELAHAVSLTSSSSQTCALHANGTTACLPFRRARIAAPVPTPGAVQIAFGNAHSCKITATHAVQCAGPLPASGPVATGADLPGLDAIDEISAGDEYSCARSGGVVSCWGANATGQTGRPRGEPGNSAVPYRIPAVADAASLATGMYHACAVRASGEVICWGDNRFAQLGAPAPMQNVGGLTNVAQVALGEWHSCALTRTGNVFCWGQNQRGQLGDGTTEDHPQPTPVRFTP